MVEDFIGFHSNEFSVFMEGNGELPESSEQRNFNFKENNCGYCKW